MYGPFSLENKKILVTGATSGLGLSVCEAIDILHGNFIGIGRNLSSLESFSDKHMRIEFDLTNLNNIDSLIEGIDPIDGFVYSAGIVDILPMKFFNQTTFDKIRTINVDAFLTLMTSLIKRKKLKKGSSIVIISSISGNSAAKGYGLYGMTKASLNLAAKAYANELAHMKVRVNSIAAGMVKTKITLKTIEQLGEEQIKADEQKYPLGYGNPEDVAYPVAFLLSNAAKWMTGEVLVLDGGRTATI